MKNIQKILVVLSLVLSAQVFAQESETTAIEGANLQCTLADTAGDGYIAINTQAQRVWQGNVGDTEALELTVKEFTTYRCPNCYRIQAALYFMGQELNVELKTSAVSGRFDQAKLVYTVVGAEEGERGSINFKCSVGNN